MLSALMVFCLTAQAADADAKAEARERIYTLTQQGLEFFKQKEYAKALGVFQEAEKLMPENPTTVYNLACAHSLLGKKKEAFACLFRSIELGYLNLAHMEADEDLAPLRGEKEWAEVAAKVKAETARREAETAKKARDEMRAALAASERLFAFDFDLKDVNGKNLALSDLRGKAVLVDIWGTWCPPCRREVPHLIALVEKYKEKGFAVVGLSNERVAGEEGEKLVRDFAEKNGINYPCGLIDTEFLKQIPGFRGYPTLIFLDREGKVRLTHVGYSPQAVLEGMVEELLEAGKPSAPAGGSAKRRWFAR
ncbi:MAG TPA: redoxin family protein [Planctomycetota bacterium]|jgi:thiol-disulfide isomerase/thioredoxin|nr:redoxin family protein [Planctomycetota bacterium]OQC19178.1 MAG: Thiol-disulfide oxidoreductase ResA [Planctomycetes bacterium ADurb.Bin069]HNS00363.1 redoxin family protein [Planctomycetota bacterium]HNU26876.1 redoxin family protein [Planctomycetota bacterium]HOE30952.1 redoxin family protein [Planctomycetota bacterium]